MKRGILTVINRLYLVLVFAVVACSPPTEEATFPDTPPGITAVIRLQSQDFEWEITENINDTLTTETYWNGEPIIRIKLYRGLYPIYRTAYGVSFEDDFDHKILDQLFPLEIGKEVSFEGILTHLEENSRIKTLVHVQVTDKGIQQIGEKSFPVYVVEITSRFTIGGESDVTHDTLYYSPDLGLVLKSVMKGSGAQSFMRIRSIDIPSNKKPKERRRNPAGTVMI